MKRGNKLWKRVLTAALSLAVAGACLPFGALAEEPETTESVEWTVSKSKTATNLDENFESKVTLSLPSAEEQLVSDVVFVLDKSTSSTVKEAAINMLGNLQQQVAETEAKVKVGVVFFNAVAYEALDLTELNDDNMPQIKEALTIDEKQLGHGTNSHAGLLAGEAMLDEDTAVDNNHKYLIFISDGITYIFGEDGMSITTRRYVGVSETNEDEGTYLIKYQDSMALTAGTKKYRDENNKEVDFIKQAGGVKAYIQTIEPLVEADENTYWVLYDPKNNTSDGRLSTSIDEPSDTALVLKGDNGLKNQNVDLFGALVGDDGINAHANNVDTALYFTYQAYQEASSKYHCYTMLATDYSTTYPWSATFMEYLKGGKDVNFSQIQNDIYYLLGAGSCVEDYIGYAENDYDFDFVNDASALSLKVGNTEYAAIEIGENHYGFAPNETDNGTVYNYELTYTRGNGQDEERFVWNINVPVSNFAPVQLTYTVKLTNPKTEAGTYGEYDADGSQNKTGLYTNNSAVLYPVDSNKIGGTPEEFPKPTVSYTVEAQPTPTPADPTPAPTPKDEHPEIAQAIKDGTWGKADPTPTPSAAPAAKVTSTHIPQTGDTSSPVLWVVAMVAALAAFAGVVILRRRSNKD